MSCQITAYTKPVTPAYPDGLARSIHFTVTMPDGSRKEINHGYGILFAKGIVNEKDVIVPKALKAPVVHEEADGSYTVYAIRTEEKGEEEKERLLLGWRTADFIHFEEMQNNSVPADDFDELLTKAEGTAASISDELCTKLLDYWDTEEEAMIPESTEFAFPKARGFGDPVIFSWEGRWYFLSTNDNVNDIGLFIRSAATIKELFDENAKLHLILDLDREHGFLQTFWAPEAHVIHGDLYILFAVSKEVFGPCCHIMKLKKGADPILAQSWELPRPVLRRDGSVLTKPECMMSEEEKALMPSVGERSKDNRFGISLDMTYLKACGKSYMVWSYRAGIGSPLDTGSMLMIAEIDETAPWQLTTDPVLISRPLYGFENVKGTINNEGPYAYYRDGRIYLNYSGGDARGYLYCINILEADEKSDLLDPGSWKKRCTPIAQFKSWEGIWGPGHNSWFTDESSREYILFHAVTHLDEKVISVGMKPYPKKLLK